MSGIRRPVRPRLVLLYGSDPIVADLARRHLVSQGYGVREAPLGPLDASTILPGEAFDLVVADLDLAEPEIWQRAASLRMTFPYVPLLLLSHVRPRAAELDRLHPCAYLRKPATRGDLSAALDAVRLAPTT